MLSMQDVASVERAVHRAAGLLTEVWCGGSAAVKVLRAQRRGRGVASRDRELRVGSLLQPPVMLVHGLGADKSCLSIMEDFLNRAGYTVYSVSYSCLGSDVEACAGVLERESSWLLKETGADRVHVVAHSLGGVVLRWAAAHTRMGEWLGVGITLGSPHRGTPAAHLGSFGLPGFGRIVGQLRPGALTIDDAGLESLADARWIAVGGENDMIVPPKYARLPKARNVRNHVVPSAGHMTLTRNLDCLAIILRELAAASVIGRQYVDSDDVTVDPHRAVLCA